MTALSSNPKTNRFEAWKEPVFQSQSKVRKKTDVLVQRQAGRRNSLLFEKKVLFRFCLGLQPIGWVRPTQIREDSLLYSVN